MMTPTTTVLTLLLLGMATPDQVVAPGDLAGLVGWYTVATPHSRTRDGEAVVRWEDASGNGHHLTAAGRGGPPRLRTLQLNGHAVVAIGGEAQFEVAEPFELEDHTVFLVYAAKQASRALFRSESDIRQGLLLGREGRLHVYQNGKAGLFPYNVSRPLEPGFSITVLGRESGKMRAFVNGTDLSSRVEFTPRIRVGRFFQLQHTTYVGSDGDGLRIAEMVFYDRFLEEGERAGITRHLSEEYGIPLETKAVARTVVRHEGELPPDGANVLVHLRGGKEQDVNGDLAALAWNKSLKVEPPFRLDPGGSSTELHCTRDRTRARVTLHLPMSTAIPDARVRALLVKNRETYHPEEAVSGPFEKDGAARRGEIRFQTVIPLDAGDYVEVFTIRAGASGRVRVRDDGAVLIVETVPGP